MIKDSFHDILDGVDLPTDEEVRKETKAHKISVANKGQKRPPMSKEVKARRIQASLDSYASGRKPPMLGKKLTDEHKAIISKANQGRVLSAEARKKISQSKKGKSYGGNYKHIKTPHGVFTSLTEAGKYEEKITGRKYNPNRFTKLINTPDSDYVKISKEEYEKLKKP